MCSYICDRTNTSAVAAVRIYFSKSTHQTISSHIVDVVVIGATTQLAATQRAWWLRTFWIGLHCYSVRDSVQSSSVRSFCRYTHVLNFPRTYATILYLTAAYIQIFWIRNKLAFVVNIHIHVCVCVLISIRKSINLQWEKSRARDLH